MAATGRRTVGWKDTLIGMDGKTRAYVHVLLEGNAELARYLELHEGTLIVHDYTYAGAGATFLIDCLRSLWGGRPADKVNLHACHNLDGANRRLWLAALQAWLDA